MMDKTIKINLGGTLFQIDEEAFTILRNYLTEINNRFKNIEGGLETIEDIESRIAEIFQSQKTTGGIISKENVDSMIKIIGNPDEFDLNEADQAPHIQTDQKRRLYRDPDDSIISGVCGGIGAYLNTDPVLFRILFAILVLFYGVGFFVYIALWIALPQAHTEVQKKELRGKYYQSTGFNKRGYNKSSPFGSAMNEVFRAIGRVLFIILRVILIIIGTALVLTGFLTILSIILVFVFKFPGFTADGFDVNLIYIPDFLSYIVSPSLAPWIIILTIAAVTLPMLALIYWGVKMVFWFRAKDGVINLAGLVIWVMTLAALAIIMFNEGISFTETSSSSSQEIITNTPDTLYIITGKKVSGLIFDKELSIREKGGKIFINDEKKELYICPDLYIKNSEEDMPRIEVRKRSSGRTKHDAIKKSNELIYDYSLKNDTLIIDEYFTLPAGRKWSADFISVRVYVPEGTIIKFDRYSQNLFHHYHNYVNVTDSDQSEDFPASSSWILTDEGLESLPK